MTSGAAVPHPQIRDEQLFPQNIQPEFSAKKSRNGRLVPDVYWVNLKPAVRFQPVGFGVGWASHSRGSSVV